MGKRVPVGFVTFQFPSADDPQKIYQSIRVMLSMILCLYNVSCVCDMPYHTNYTIPYDIIPCHTIPHHTIPHHTTPYHTIPHHTIAYHSIPYNTIPYTRKNEQLDQCCQQLVLMLCCTLSTMLCCTLNNCC